MLLFAARYCHGIEETYLHQESEYSMKKQLLFGGDLINFINVRCQLSISQTRLILPREI